MTTFGFLAGEVFPSGGTEPENPKMLRVQKAHAKNDSAPFFTRIGLKVKFIDQEFRFLQSPKLTKNPSPFSMLKGDVLLLMRDLQIPGKYRPALNTEKQSK
jgi:hypothetical protein